MLAGFSMTADRPPPGLVAATRRTQAAGFILSSAVVFVVSAAATVYFCRSMAGGMDMPGGWTMSMAWMRMPGQTWPASAAMFLLMWLAMMVAMMLPSTLPMLLACRRALQTQGAAHTGLSTFLAACGYFFPWLLAGIVVYPIGAEIALVAMRSAAFSRAVPIMSGATLVLSGCIQFTPWKRAGLCRCRDPLVCCASPVSNLRTGWRFGLRLGAACVICCSGLMLVLMVLGVMDLAVMAIVSVVIAIEKLFPKPEPIVWLSGLAAMTVGLFMLIGAFF
jgi:predicted metal-binding membrane protein